MISTPQKVTNLPVLCRLDRRRHPHGGKKRPFRGLDVLKDANGRDLAASEEAGAWLKAREATTNRTPLYDWRTKNDHSFAPPAVVCLRWRASGRPAMAAIAGGVAATAAATGSRAMVRDRGGLVHSSRTHLAAVRIPAVLYHR